MFRNAIISASLVALMSGGALAATSVMVQEIDAQVDLTALENTDAAARYANIEGDLESALAARLVDHIADEGLRIVIDISEVELSSSFQESMNIGDTHLVGNVTVINDEEPSEVDVYVMTVNIDQAKVFFPADLDVVTLTASSDTFYKAMIDAFAEGVAARLLN
jgi:hypothetical protein